MQLSDKKKKKKRYYTYYADIEQGTGTPHATIYQTLTQQCSEVTCPKTHLNSVGQLLL